METDWLPKVTAIIPTCGRPTLVQRAVLSVLNQTFSALEVVVVIDGPDLETEQALWEFQDHRLRVLALNNAVGGAEARNIGARSARGGWVAFLDDDDEWLPEKIETQFAIAAQHADQTYVFIASRYIERSQNGERVLPARSLDFNTPYSDFLFCRTSLRGGTGYVQTSTWFISKSLIDICPFTKGLKRNQDVDWMLHAMAIPDVKMVISPDPLTLFYEDRSTGRVSKQPDWRFQLAWLEANRSYLTDKAYSFGVATLCVPEAVKQGASPRIYLKLFNHCVFKGSATFYCLLFFFYYLFFSDLVRLKLRSRMHGQQSAVH